MDYKMLIMFHKSYNLSILGNNAWHKLLKNVFLITDHLV